MTTSARRTLNVVAGVITALLVVGVVWVALRDARDDDSAAAADPMAGMNMSGDGVVRLNADAARSLGITVVTAELGAVRRALRITGAAAYDESRMSTITAKFGGFIERLHVDNTGQYVRRGQTVMEVYSPDLVSAQEELLSAMRLQQQLAGSAAPGVAERAERLVQAARQKLLLWDIAPAQVDEVQRTGVIKRTLPLPAASAGFVVEKMVQAGQSIDAGMPLLRLADLATVWIEADIYEQDLRFVRVGEQVSMELAAYPDQPVTGRIAYIYPDVRADTRTARVRITLPNPGARIKPGMLATVVLDSDVTERAVLVPRDAVMRSGTRDHVFVETAPGVYEPRTVQLGAETDGRTQILAGLLAGERVVARANFLLDAETRLMQTMGGMPMTTH